MMLYCAINLNTRYWLGFKHSRDNKHVFRKKIIIIKIIIDFIQHMYLHWHYFIKNSSRWSVKMWKKIEKWYLLKLTGRKGFMIGSHCSRFQFVKQASVKQLFTNHLGLRIISFTSLQMRKKWRKKEMGVVQTCKKKFKQFKKLISL